jgi:uncharacterized membrane protein
MNKLLKESIIWGIMTIPFIYLSTVWNLLPFNIPTHFGLSGEADGWMSKPVFIWFLVGVIVGLYLLFWIIPRIDPKKRIHLMGEKYYSLRLIFSAFFSLIACLNIYFALKGNLDSPQILVGLMGFLFAVIGNYSQAIRPNYYLGFRTPWTLKSEKVWKTTHIFGGRVWVIGGLITILLSCVIKDNLTIFILLMMMVTLLVTIPTVYSYRMFKREN